MAETTNNAPDLKVRYSDEELQEFKAIILEMLEKAKEEYKTLRDVVTHASSNDVEDTSPTFKIMEEGATALNSIFVSLLYQMGGELYINNNKETGLLLEEGMEAFETWTEFYTLYSFPSYASFINRFRSGEMPLGIIDYTTYNTLTVSGNLDCNTSGSFTNKASSITAQASGAHTIKGSPLSLN